VFRDQWELADDADYRRQLLFERVHDVADGAVSAR